MNQFYRQTVLLSGNIVILRGRLLLALRWLFGGWMPRRVRHAHVTESFQLVLDTIDTLPQSERDRWDVREIQDMSASLLDDIRNHRDAPGEARERAFAIHKKIQGWRGRPVAGAVKPDEEVLQ